MTAPFVDSVNLHIPQGTTWSISFPVLNEVGQPMDVASWTARAQVRKKANGDVLFEWRTSGGPGRIDMHDKTVTLFVDPAQSTAWNWRSGRYDLELTDPLGAVWRPLSGRVWVYPEITK